LPVVPLPDAPAHTPKTQDLEADYRAALALFKSRKFDDAARAFSRLAKENPKHSLAPGAALYLAKCAFGQGQYRRAAWLLRGLLGQHPSSGVAPAALLMLSECEDRLGRSAEARKVLAQVVQLYPKSPEAAQAARQMRGNR
jgi:tol-pal system protein YbgF